MTRLAFYFHTVRHLRPQQVRLQILQRLRAPRPVRAPGHALTQRSGLVAPVSRLPRHGAMTRDQCTFLQVSAPLYEGLPDWAAPGMSRLWRYHLHYFDFLAQPDLSDDLKARLVDDWIARNPPGTADAWDPFPVSLRIVNWVFFFLARAGQSVPGAWLTSLWTQADWLQRNFEYHLLANHLLKNTVGLLFAGAYFSGSRADRWLARGWREFLEQIEAQFLPDGGHFERSPMYHSICLADCLDVLELARQPTLASALSGTDKLEQITCRGAQFLADMVAPDGEIALFNDSAFGIAPAPRDLLARAASWLPPERAGAAAAAAPAAPAPGDAPTLPVLIQRSDCGYYGVRSGRDLLLVDCGAIGPDFQPGHAHCDTLSYELSLDGERVIVDSGVHDYQAGENRRLCRSTIGHNTVVIDGAEQSEIWGVFRVARRARPLHAHIAAMNDGGWEFEGSHDGYMRLPGRPVHRRRMVGHGCAIIEVVDEITGSGRHTAESRIRLHPRCQAVAVDSGVLEVRGVGKTLARIEFPQGLKPQLEQGSYFPQFGGRDPCAVAVLRVSGHLPLRLSYRIVKVR